MEFELIVGSIVRAVLVFGSMVAVPLLLNATRRHLCNKASLSRRERVWAQCAAVITLILWGSFVAMFFLGMIGGFGMHVVSARQVDLFLLPAFLNVVLNVGLRIAIPVLRGRSVLASLTVLMLWTGAGMVA